MILIMSLRMLLYHKGTKFLANHNTYFIVATFILDVIVPQRYKIFSKSQSVSDTAIATTDVITPTKGPNGYVP